MNESENNNNEKKETSPNNKKNIFNRSWVFYLKVVSVFCLLMLISFGIAIFYVLNKLTSDSNFEKLVNQKVSEATAMNVNFEKISVSFPSIELKNIHIATDSASMKLDSRIASVKVRPDFFAALRGTILINYLSISSSTTLLEMKAISSEDVAVKNKNTGSSSFDINSITFPFKSIDIREVALNYVDDASKSSYDINLNKASLSHSIVSSALPFEIEAELVGKANLISKGSLYWPTKVLSDIKLQITDINEVKKLIPAEYKNYLNSITGSSANASIEYNIENNSINISSYNVGIEPLASIYGTANIPQISPIKLQASATTSDIEVSNIWQIVKGFVPSEYGVTLNKGSVATEIGVYYEADKPLQLVALAKPRKIEIKTKYLTDKIFIQEGNINYDGENISSDNLEIDLSDSKIRLSSIKLSLADFSLNTVFAIKIGIEGLLRNLKDYISDGMKNLNISGNINMDGNINGKVNNLSSLKVNGSVVSKLINLTEKNTKAKGTVEDLNIRLNALGAESGSISIDSLRASATGANLSFNGTIKNQKYIGFDCNANGGINVDEFSKLASSLFNLPVKDGQYKGQLDLSLKLGGNVKDPRPFGKIVAKNIYADVSEYGMVINNFNGSISADNDKLIFENVKANLLGGDLNFNGTISNFKNMKVEAVANIRGTDLAMVRKLIGVNVPEMPSELDFSGKADLNTSLKGSTSAPVINGSALIVDGRFIHPSVFRPVEKINGRVVFNNKGLTLNNVTAFWGTSQAKVQGNINDWAKFVTDLKFEVLPLDVTDAAGFFLEGTGLNVIGIGSGIGTVTGPIEKIKVDCVANVNVGTITALITEGGDSMKFPYQNLTAKAVYQNSVLDVSSASLNLFKGDIFARTKFYIASEPIKYGLDAKINQLQTQEFLRANAEKKYENTLVGALDGSIAIKGDVTGLNSINGNANLSMASGTYDSPDLIKKIADKIKNPSLASGTIENVSGDYTIANGRISSNNMMGKSKDSNVVFNGSIGLDTTLDGTLNFILGKETCQNSSYLREMLGNSENLTFPCKVKGSLTSPNIDLPIDTLVKEKAKNEINKLLGKNGSDSDKSNKVVDKINDGVSKLGKSLKKIFK